MYVLVDNGVAIKYPYTINQFRRDNPQISISDSADSHSLESHGIFRVVVTGQPAYDQATQRVVEGIPTYDGEQWNQSWQIIDLEIGEILGALSSLVDTKRENITEEHMGTMYQGVQYDFGGTIDHVQVRNQQDMINLLTIKDSARDAKEMGITAPILQFRAASDTSYFMTPDEMITMCNYVRGYMHDLYKTMWARKDALDDINLEDADAAEQIDSV